MKIYIKKLLIVIIRLPMEQHELYKILCEKQY